MKLIQPLKEHPIPLHAASLDLRSPAGKTNEGYYRLIVNGISDTQGRMRRIGGWRKLQFVGGTNEDLHDQLLAPAVDVMLTYSLGKITVLPPVFNSQSPGAITWPTTELALTGPDLDGGSPDFYDLPALLVVAPSFLGSVSWNGVKWQTYIRTSDDITESDPAWVDLDFYSATYGAGTTRFYLAETRSTNYVGYATACAPRDATGWSENGDCYKCSAWNLTDAVLGSVNRLTYPCP